MNRSRLETKFALCWLGIHGPPLVEEHAFAKPRRWRFDFAHLDTKTAIEIEGGTWTNGRHSRGAGMAKDAEKYNTAATLGWHVFRLTPDMVGTEWARKIRDHIKRKMQEENAQ